MHNPSSSPLFCGTPSAIVVAVASFTYGMLRGVTDWPGIYEVWYLPAFIAVSGIAQIFVKRRYQ